MEFAAGQDSVQDLPEDALVFLLGSRRSHQPYSRVPCRRRTDAGRLIGDETLIRPIVGCVLSCGFRAARLRCSMFADSFCSNSTIR
jgi:hypothetical protein